MNYTIFWACNQPLALLESGYQQGDYMSAKTDKILNVEELAEFFGVSNQTVWRWCKTGKLPAFKIGSQWKIRQSDLNKVIHQKLSKRDQNLNHSLF